MTEKNRFLLLGKLSIMDYSSECYLWVSEPQFSAPIKTLYEVFFALGKLNLSECHLNVISFQEVTDMLPTLLHAIHRMAATVFMSICL
jgi:hypothetical protein